MWAYVRLYRNLQLADTLPVEFENVSIDILIGNDYYLDLILPERMEIQKGFYLLASRLRWILIGRTQRPNYEDEAHVIMITSGTWLITDTASIPECRYLSVKRWRFWESGDNWNSRLSLNLRCGKSPENFQQHIEDRKQQIPGHMTLEGRISRSSRK